MSTAPAVARLATRLVHRGGLVVVAISAGMSALVAVSYDGMMTDSGAAGSLGALAANPAIRTLFGEPFALDTAGGYTVWRTGTVLAVLIGAWAVLATTRVTRGEEDAGRWDLLLSGRTPLRGAVAAHLLVVAAVPVTLTAAVWAALTAAGTAPGSAAVHAAGLGATGLFFTAVAAVTAQIHPSRSAATGSAVTVLALGLLARMIGDGVPELTGLRWLSPFGLLELSRPYAGDRWAPVLLVVAAAVLLAGAALVLAGRRDVRGGLLRPVVGRPPRTLLLGSVPAFAVRRLLPPLAGWCAAVGSYYLLIGLVAASVTEFLRDNAVFAQAAATAGFASLTHVEGFAATLFALLAMPLGGFAADRLSAFTAAEADGRLTALAAQPVTRRHLLGAETAAVILAVFALAVVAATATWLGATVSGAHLPWSAGVAGTLNIVPLVLLGVGAAVLAIGWLPRFTALVGAVPTVGGFLLQVVASSAGAPGWVAGLSPYAHVAAVPLEPVDLGAAAVMVAGAVALGAAGMSRFARRDLRA
jgi:ABC-2 type transport system permease protein